MFTAWPYTEQLASLWPERLRQPLCRQTSGSSAPDLPVPSTDSRASLQAVLFPQHLAPSPHRSLRIMAASSLPPGSPPRTSAPTALSTQLRRSRCWALPNPPSPQGTSPPHPPSARKVPACSLRHNFIDKIPIPRCFGGVCYMLFIYFPHPWNNVNAPGWAIIYYCFQSFHRSDVWHVAGTKLPFSSQWNVYKLAYVLVNSTQENIYMNCKHREELGGKKE